MSKPYERWKNHRHNEHHEQVCDSLREHSRKYTGIFAGIILVVLGVVLLLNILGIIKISIWHGFAMYWPVGLILIGIAIILRLRWFTVTFVILTVLLCTAFFAADISGPITGSGVVVSKTYDVNTFEKIHLEVPAQVYLTQGLPGSAVNVTVVGDDNILEIVESKVSGDTLTIQYSDGFRFWNIWGNEGLKIYITAPNIKSIRVDGAGTLMSKNQIVTDNLELELSGAADVDMDVSVNTLTTEVSGFSDMTLKGKADNYSASISGASDIKAYDLVVSNAKVHISGSGDVKLNVIDKLDVDISGAGDINYKGSPVVTQKISGAGDIKKVD